MWPIYFPSAISLLLTILFSAVIVHIFLKSCLRFEVLYDQPDARKKHAAPTPSVGGLAFWAAFIAALALISPPLISTYLTYLVAASFLTWVGVVDDAVDLGPVVKLVAQLGCIGAAILATSDTYLTFGFDLPALGALGTLVSFGGTLLLMAYYTNAFNMTDGIDGQAGSLGVVSLVFVAIIAELLGCFDIATLALLLVCAVVGFLFWNFRAPWRPRASVFMGDAGSLMLGFSVAWAAFYLTKKGMPEILMLWLMAVPVFDATVVAIRRMLKGKNPMRGDRTHLHHLLEFLGLCVPSTVGVVMVMVALFSAVGIFFWVSKIDVFTQLLLWCCSGLIYFVTSVILWKKTGAADA